MQAAQRGRLERTITLAHQIEAVAMSVTADRRGLRKLKPLAEFLKPLRASVRSTDGSEAVADFLDRKIAKQERASREPGA